MREWGAEAAGKQEPNSLLSHFDQTAAAAPKCWWAAELGAYLWGRDTKVTNHMLRLSTEVRDKGP